MSGLIGKKIGMTSLYDENGSNLACTVIEAGPCVVTQIKNEEKDGYNSVQLGFLEKKERNINNLKEMLANEATKILHGKVASKKAEQTAKETFQEGGFGKELPEIRVSLNEIKKGVNILDFLSKNQIMSSKSEARRAVYSKGLKINNVLIEDEKKIIDLDNFKNKVLKLSYGKKRHYLIRII